MNELEHFLRIELGLALGNIRYCFAQQNAACSGATPGVPSTEKLMSYFSAIENRALQLADAQAGQSGHGIEHAIRQIAASAA